MILLKLKKEEEYKKMNRLNVTILMFTSILTSCSYRYQTNVNEIIELRSENHKNKIQVQGYIIVEDLTLIRLYPSKDSEDYIDVIINTNSQINVKLKDDKYVCTNIIGNFHWLKSDSITVGNSTSKYGAIIVKSANKCQNRLKSVCK